MHSIRFQLPGTRSSLSPPHFKIDVLSPLPKPSVFQPPLAPLQWCISHSLLKQGGFCSSQLVKQGGISRSSKHGQCVALLSLDFAPACLCARRREGVGLGFGGAGAVSCAQQGFVTGSCRPGTGAAAGKMQCACNALRCTLLQLYTHGCAVQVKQDAG